MHNDIAYIYYCAMSSCTHAGNVKCPRGCNEAPRFVVCTMCPVLRMVWEGHVVTRYFVETTILVLQWYILVDWSSTIFRYCVTVIMWMPGLHTWMRIHPPILATISAHQFTYTNLNCKHPVVYTKAKLVWINLWDLDTMYRCANGYFYL